MHDARLLKKSSLYERGNNGELEDCVLLGDSAYPSLTWLISPFKDNGNLTDEQKRFNFLHSSARVVIEHAFGLLKGRFRLLKFFDNDNIKFVVKCDIDLDGNYECDDEFIRHVSSINPQENKRKEILTKMVRLYGNSSCF